MPRTITNEDGTEEEVFSVEEAQSLADQKAQEEREKLEVEKQEALDAAEAEKADLQKKLKGFEDKDYNFKNLRRKKGDEDTDPETPSDVQAKIDALAKQIADLADQPKSETKSEFMKAKIAEDDKDTRDKFEYYYSRLGKEAKTKEEVLRASQEALSLATEGVYQPSSDRSIFSVGVSQNYRETAPSGPSESFKAIAAQMGNTEEDIKKYGKLIKKS